MFLKIKKKKRSMVGSTVREREREIDKWVKKIKFVLEKHCTLLVLGSARGEIQNGHKYRTCYK